jgi:hypothetical protein
MGEFDSCFEDALAPTARDVVAVADGDDDWFARAADGTPSVEERAMVPREAIGAAALSPDRELARRSPRRRRRRKASRSAARGGRPSRRPVRLVGAGMLAVVVLSLALVARAPHTHRGGERASSTTTARSSAAVDAARPVGAAPAAGPRKRRRTAAARRAHQPIPRRRGQRARPRPNSTMHRRRRSRPVAARPMAAAPAPPMAPAPARPAVRPVRAPDPSFTPGDLPLASEAP